MTDSKRSILPKEEQSYISATVEMGRLIHEKDWSKTALGNPENWPLSLRTIVTVILDNPLGMCIAWGKDLIQIYNDAFGRLLGSAKHPLALGQSCSVTFAEVWDSMKPMLQKVMKGESIHEIGFKVVLNGGNFPEERYFNFAFSPVRYEGGKPGGVLITVVEVTDRKKVEDELKEARERMEYATNAADVATWVFDPQQYTFAFDQLLRDWFGLPQDEQLPLQLAMERVVPEDKIPLEKAIEASLKIESGIINHEYTIIHPETGKQRILKVKGKAVFNKQKVATKLYGILQDITSETLAQRKMKESAANFMNMVTQAPFSIAILRGPQYIVEVVNDRALELWRRKREDVMGKPILESIPELAEQGIREMLDGVYKSGESFSATEMPVLILKDGEPQETFLNFNYQALKNMKGESEAILAIGVNVTDLVKTRRFVEESEKTLRSIVENSPFPIAVYVGKEMKIQLANETMLNTWGKGKDVIGKLYSEVLPELENQAVFQQLEKVYTTGIPFHARNRKIELVVDGRLQTFYFNYSFTPLFNVEEEVYGIMNTAADVTDLVNAIQKTEKSEEQLRIALDGGELGTFDFYPLEKKLLWSAKTKELFGLSPDAEVNCETYLKAIHGADTGNSVALSQNRFPLENGLYELEYRVVGIEDGKVRWVKSKGKASYDEEGKPVRFTGVVQEITKLKEAEAETQKLTDILKASQEFIGMANTDGNLVYLNPAALKMVGWTDFHDRTILDCIYPEDRELARKLLSGLVEKGEFHHEIRMLNEATGETFWLLWNGIAIKETSTGQVVALATVSPNITDRKIAEEALKASEARFRTMADTISHLAWVADAKGYIFWYNRKWYEYTGTTFEEMKGWGWQSVHDPDTLPEVMKNWTNAIEHGVPFEMIFPLKGADGNFREFLTRVVPIRNNAGDIFQWFGTNTDITERIRIEQELKASEARFRMFADSMPQIVWAADPEGNLTYINKAFYIYSGLSPDAENLGEKWLDIIHPDEREETVRNWEASMRSGTEFTIEHRFQSKNGEYRWQLTRGVPIYDEQGNVETWVATSTDIQEIKELDQQKDHFISIASHELKTPITSIKGYVQILESIYKESEDAFLKKSLSAVDKQIVKLTNLISDLLDLSKLKLGNLHLVKESFNLNELVEEVVEEMRLVKQDFTIQVNLGKDAHVFADRERISQVLVNFLTNAIKYSPKNKLVEVRSIVDESYFTVFVKDKGIGINKQSQEKVFERFYRVEGTNEKTYPGFGIGLFICSEIIERHNGKIGVDSVPGEGSEFYFSLPID